MSDFILMIAMKAELPDLFPRPFGTWCMGGSTVRVVKTGMGKNKAGAAMQKILGQSEPGNSCNSGNSCKSVNPAFIPDFILALGFCGGTRDDLAIGDLIVADRVRYRDRVIDLPTSPYLDRICGKMAEKMASDESKIGSEFKTGPEFKAGSELKTGQELKTGYAFQRGTVQTFNFPVFSRRRVSEDAVAVDMEAFALAKIAKEYGIPLIVVKAVSDIVPERGGLAGCFEFCRNIRKGAGIAKLTLNRFMADLLSWDL